MFCHDVMDVYLLFSQVHTDCHYNLWSPPPFPFPPLPPLNHLARYQGDLCASVVGDSASDARMFYEQAVSLDPSQGVCVCVCVCVCMYVCVCGAFSNLIIN